MLSICYFYLANSKPGKRDKLLRILLNWCEMYMNEKFTFVETKNVQVIKICEKHLPLINDDNVNNGK